MEATYNKLLEVEPAYLAFLKAEGKGELEGSTVEEKLRDAADKGIINASQVDAINEYDAMRYDCLLTDAFDKDLKEVQVHAERPMSVSPVRKWHHRHFRPPLTLYRPTAGAVSRTANVLRHALRKPAPLPPFETRCS